MGTCFISNLHPPGGGALDDHGESLWIRSIRAKWRVVGILTAVYDAIVVGARCAGSPLAMLLARRGYRILLVNRARFPSDAVSTHYIHQPGVAP